MSFSLLGFIPQAQFIFAKNCNQVWAEAMNDFTQRHGQQECHELSKEVKGGKEREKDQEPEAEEPELKQVVAQMRWGKIVVGVGACAQAWGHRGDCGCGYRSWGLAATLFPVSLNSQCYFSFINVSQGFPLLHG